MLLLLCQVVVLFSGLPLSRGGANSRADIIPYSNGQSRATTCFVPDCVFTNPNRCGTLGFKLVNGCEVCECNCPNVVAHSCPTLRCTYGLRVDQYGCTQCACNSAPTRAPTPCGVINCGNLRCRIAFTADAAGCPQCSCYMSQTLNPPPVRAGCAPLNCGYLPCGANGRAVGADGCPTCACQAPPTRSGCGALNCGALTCANGYVLGADGCAICQCRTPVVGRQPCVTPNCGFMYCENGLAVDAQGCHTCSCRQTRAPSGQVCRVSRCDNYCPYGYAVVAGCLTCTCLSTGRAPVNGATCAALTCEHACVGAGRRAGADGCPTCDCCPEAHCADQCAGTGLYRFELEDGCPSCQCGRKQCPCTQCRA